MKKYRIAVNGKMFEVEVEEVAGQVCASTPVPAPAAPKGANPGCAQGSLPPRPARLAGPLPSGSTGSKNGFMTSPLPGVILGVPAKPGKGFSQGEILLKIEAMKMENEILAPYDCRVEEVCVSEGQTVKTGDPLLRIERC